MEKAAAYAISAFIVGFGLLLIDTGGVFFWDGTIFPGLTRTS
jgi:hypothetical protein